MYQKYRILALIPARGGSKGLPRKNILEAGGKPLLAWSIEAARASRYVDRVILSSEDEEIIATARAWNCEVPFRRPPELAQDTTPGNDVVQHALAMVPDYDVLVLLQPTSPLRTAEDIDACIEQCLANDANACVSVCETAKHPYWMFAIDAADRLRPLYAPDEIPARRQDLPPVYVLNGAVYVARCAWLKQQQTFLTAETLAYVMPRERSLDIDSAVDFTVLKAVVENL